jgi:hypothetical protein
VHVLERRRRPKRYDPDEPPSAASPANAQVFANATTDASPATCRTDVDRVTPDIRDDVYRGHVPQPAGVANLKRVTHGLVEPLTGLAQDLVVPGLRHPAHDWLPFDAV